MEKWPSGWRRHPAKVLGGVICLEGSNPSFSAILTRKGLFCWGRWEPERPAERVLNPVFFQDRWFFTWNDYFCLNRLCVKSLAVGSFIRIIIYKVLKVYFLTQQVQIFVKYVLILSTRGFQANCTLSSWSVTWYDFLLGGWH